MDDDHQPPAKPLSDSFPIDDGRALFLDGCKIAIFGFDDPNLESFLIASGAILCASDDPTVSVIVVDSTTVNAKVLRDRLSPQVIDRVHTGEIQVVGRSHFDDCLGSEPTVHTLYTRSMLADLLGVATSTLRSWQRRGLIQPINNVSKLAYFDFREVLAAKQLATFVELGVQPATIEKNLKQLASWLPMDSQPLSQLSVLVDGKKILLRQANGLVEPGGQRRLDFDSACDTLNPETPDSDEPVGIIPFVTPEPELMSLESPDQFVEAAERLEEAGNLLPAIEIYRSMQLAVGPNVEACMRIGELLFRMGDLPGARERFFMAIELDNELVEARAALGCVLNDLGETDFAISAFEGALELHADYADVHFQLARIQQNAGNLVQALVHWKRFVSLSPSGPWADEAKHQLRFIEEEILEPSVTVTDR